MSPIWHLSDVSEMGDDKTLQGLDFKVRHYPVLPLCQSCSARKFVESGKTYEEELEAVAIGSVIARVKSRMSAAFLSDFMEKTGLLIIHRESLLAPVLLVDTYDAVTQLKTCNASLRGVPDPSAAR